MYGVEMRLPVETALGKLLPAHVRPSDDVDAMTKQLTLMRMQAQQLAQECRERGAKTANKNRITPEFQIGDREYKVKDSLTADQDYKTAPKFEGPYSVIDRGPHHVYKLAHVHSGKVLRDYIHVSKLKSCAAARAARKQPETINTLHADSECNPTQTPEDGREPPVAERISNANDLYVAFGQAKLDSASNSERGKAKADSCDRPAQSQRNLGETRARRKPRRLCIIARLRG